MEGGRKMLFNSPNGKNINIIPPLPPRTPPPCQKGGQAKFILPPNGVIPPPPKAIPKPPQPQTSRSQGFGNEQKKPNYTYLEMPKEDVGNLDNLFGLKSVPLIKLKRKKRMTLQAPRKNSKSDLKKNRITCKKIDSETGLELLICRKGDTFTSEYMVKDVDRLRKKRSLSMNDIKHRNDIYKIHSASQLIEEIDKLKAKINLVKKEKQEIDDNLSLLQQKFCDKNEKNQMLQLEIDELENEENQ